MPVCEVCEFTNFDLIATEIREGAGRIMKCHNCGLVIQDTEENAEGLKDYYENEYQRTNSLVAGKVQSPREHFEDRLKSIGKVFDKVKPLLNPGARVLEIGCGAGALLSLIKPFVSHCVGIELHSPFAEFVERELEIEAHVTDVNTLNLTEKFDVIISIATLDHLPNPFETLLTMKNLLAPGGKIYCEVPNLNEALNRFIPSPNREKFNRFFWHKAHLFYFDQESIKSLFKKAGLRISISSRHDYTLKNFFNWYFLGKPQKIFVEATCAVEFFKGEEPFERCMNEMLFRMDREFRSIMEETFCGDNLCCIGWIEKTNLKI